MTRWMFILLVFIILLSLTACQPAPAVLALPTLAHLPSPVPSALPALTSRPVSADLPASPTTIIATAATSDAQAVHTSADKRFVFGQSAQGRDLRGRHFGSGSQTLLLVGGIHAGYEANTVRLMNELIAHYTASPDAVPAAVSLLIIPALNVDGVERGRDLAGRWNAAGVDLNRNWACGWSPEAAWRMGRARAGQQPLDQPETAALATFITQQQPDAVLFFHAAANGVFAGDCDGGVSQPLAAVYGAAAGYPYEKAFTAYSTSGTAADWVDSLGIPSADVELASAQHSEFDRNLRAVEAVMQWLVD